LKVIHFKLYFNVVLNLQKFKGTLDLLMQENLKIEHILFF
jgi:hypothetical protein